MALLHQAEITPTKLELLTAWVPSQPWFAGDTGIAFANVGAYRFDDPAGEVGIETVFLQTDDGVVLQVPLTYRGAPLVGGEQWLITTMQHSVLGERWVYDGVGDPVYLAAVASVALTGGVQAEQYLEIDGERVVREPTARVVGDGKFGTPTPPAPPIEVISTHQNTTTTVTDAGEFQVVVLRRLIAPGQDTTVQTSATATSPTATLAGGWLAQPDPQRLVMVTVG